MRAKRLSLYAGLLIGAVVAACGPATVMLVDQAKDVALFRLGEVAPIMALPIAPEPPASGG